MSFKKQNLNTLFRELPIVNNNNCHNYDTNIDIDTVLKYGKSDRNMTIRSTNIDDKNFNNNILKYNLLNNESNNDSNNESNNKIKYDVDTSKYLDNTKRKNLDTSIYTYNPSKIQGRGFGNINEYGLLLNGIGISTRQENQEKNPRNVEDDRIFFINHNNYNPKRITDDIPCGADTRYLNKKMI